MQSSSCSRNWSLSVMLIVDLSLARVIYIQHSPFPVLCLAYTRVVSQIDGAVRVYEHVHDDHYLTRSKFNSLLTEMITPQTYIHTSIYIYIHIKPLPVPRVFGARSGSPRIIRMAIPYRTAKFKSANILAIAILGSTAKFNSRQYFRLYGTSRVPQ